MPADAIVLLPGLSQLMDGLCRSGLAYVRIIINEKKNALPNRIICNPQCPGLVPGGQILVKKGGKKGKDKPKPTKDEVRSLIHPT